MGVVLRGGVGGLEVEERLVRSGRAVMLGLYARECSRSHAYRGINVNTFRRFARRKAATPLLGQRPKQFISSLFYYYS